MQLVYPAFWSTHDLDIPLLSSSFWHQLLFIRTKHNIYLDSFIYNKQLKVFCLIFCDTTFRQGLKQELSWFAWKIWNL